MGVCNCSMFCCTLLCVHSSIAIILMGKRELIALLNLSSWCLVMVERLFLAVPRGCLRFVIVVFPDHTHLLFLEDPRFVARHSLLYRIRDGLVDIDAGMSTVCILPGTHQQRDLLPLIPPKNYAGMECLAKQHNSRWLQSYSTCQTQSCLTTQPTDTEPRL